jgi:hypothetical protein
VEIRSKIPFFKGGREEDKSVENSLLSRKRLGFIIHHFAFILRFPSAFPLYGFHPPLAWVNILH